MGLFTTESLFLKYSKSERILEAKAISPDDQLEKELNIALKLSEDKIGGSGKDAETMSFDSIKRVLDIIPSDMVKEEKPNPIIQKIFFNLTDPDRAEIIQKYVDKEANDLDEIIKKHGSNEGVGKIYKRDDSYVADFNQSAQMIMRFEKLYNIYSKSANKINLDKELEILKSLRAIDAVLDLGTIGSNASGKIGKIGGLDSDIDKEYVEIIMKDSSMNIPKSYVSKIISASKSISDKIKSRTESEHAKRLNGIAKSSAEAIKNWYDWASGTFSNLVDDIKGDSGVDADNKMDSADEFSSNTGGSVFNMVFNYGSKETTLNDELNRIEADAIIPEDIPGRRNIRKKKSIFRKIKETIAMAALPVIQNENIKRAGDYYRLFTTLNQEKPDWMNTVLLNKVFQGETKEFNDFKGGISKEDPREAIQLAYLEACVEWTYRFIESDYISSFTAKEADDCRKAIDMIVIEKKSEIKNYYLSRDFNLGNFNSVLIKPEADIKLYKTIQLAISEEDRKKESSLRNVAGGVGKFITGAFGGIAVDTAALARGKAFAEGDRKFMVGLNQFIKGIVGTVGGKEAARKYNKALPDKWKSDKDKEKSVREDMISPMDSPTSTMVPMEGPGSSHQIPGMMPGNNMDMMSLAGPAGGSLTTSKTKSKKSGKRSKKKKGTLSAFGTTRVLNFEDFMNKGEY